MPSIRLLILAATLLIGGCSSDGESPADSRNASLPGVYSGTFPCANCPGIRTTLWLRSDGRFFIRQVYLEATDNGSDATYNLGRWNSIADGRIIELRGAGPKRSYTRPDRETLVLYTESDLEYRLTRDQGMQDFTPMIAMSGMMSMSGDSATFSECLTGLVAPVDKGGDFARFQRQYRNANARGKPAFVEFDGRFLWSGDGSLKSFTIDAFKTVRDGREC
jgi:copper homeostasis protein (lipoprotein)